jgi:hypothetical protein
MEKQIRIWALVAFALAGTAILSGPVVAQVSKTDAKLWAEACMTDPPKSSYVMQRCCEEQAAKNNKECKAEPDAAVCKNTVNVCKEVVKCYAAMNKCKEKAMETDKDCSKDACKQCSSEHKSCRDSAMN